MSGLGRTMAENERIWWRGVKVILALGAVAMAAVFYLVPSCR